MLVRMNIEDFGKYFKREREIASHCIQNVAIVTGINAERIKAIESGAVIPTDNDARELLYSIGKQPNSFEFHND